MKIMNIAVIFAGGTGQRMNKGSRPKQFLELYNKPILIYTLEHFQSHPEIDSIVLVCLDSWIDYTKELLKKWEINKVKAIVPGGDCGQASIRNGIVKAYELFPKDSTVLIHDGVRPLIDQQVITKAIACVKLNGSAITVSPAIETIVLKQDDGMVGNILDRKFCEMAKAPQCFVLEDIYNAHMLALAEKKLDFIDSAFLMQHYGYRLSTIVGPPENIKITTPIDFYVFKALIDAQINMQALGM